MSVRVCLLVLGALVSSGAQRPPCPPADTILPCVCATANEEVQVWCTHSDTSRVTEGLKTIGEYLTRPVDELIIEHNYLPSLPGRAFRSVKALRLMLRHNGLERVAPGWLAGLESTLMELFVVENELRSLPVDGVAHMKKLQAITVESDRLKRLPSFSRLSNLKYVKVESSSLIEVNGRSFKNVPALERLHITGSPRLVRLEAGAFHDMPRLRSLNVSRCGLEWIHPRAMSSLPSLAEVSLEGNRLKDAGMVGRACRELSALSVLRLDGNRIDRLNEASFVDLPALRELSVSRNAIAEIFHGAFHRVPSLKVLDLNDNVVRRVHPESFLQPSGSGLEELWLVGNEMSHASELRAVMDALPTLKFLDLSENALREIPYGALRGHPTLERLHLDGNGIGSIEREAFTAMPALRELRLRNNSLSNHIDGPFWNLPALKGLDLSQNRFRRLEPRLVTNLPSLRKLDLSDNEIAIVDPMTFAETPLLENVDLARNSLASVGPATFAHLTGLYELDASGNRLVEFVPGLPRNLEYLRLSGNQIRTLPLPPSPDLDLPSLRVLDLSANSIRRIPPRVMSALPQLRRLDLSYNGVQSLEEGSFAGLGRLEALILRGNAIARLGPGVFGETIGLTALDLRANALETFGGEVLRDTPHLRRLDLSRNGLRDLAPGALGSARALEHLDVSSNRLTSLTEALTGLADLRTLDVSGNRLKDVPSTVAGGLSSLRELRMSNNSVSELREGTFRNLPSLEVLDLRRNRLETIRPGAFRSVPRLESVLLNENRLSEIPERAFSELPSLRSVELQSNRLTRVSGAAFHAAPRLQFLNLTDNKIDDLDSAGLGDLRSLEVLDLSDNRITSIRAPSLEKMEWLVELKVDNNRICAVRGAPFDRMPRLKVLSMRNNRLSFLPETAVESLRSNIAVLDIDGNPLSCGCGLSWLRSWLQEAPLAGPRCSDGTLLKDSESAKRGCERGREPQEEEAFPGCEHAARADTLVPSPEESEYFYDEYVEYPYNETDPLNRTRSEKGFAPSEPVVVVGGFLPIPDPVLSVPSNEKEALFDTPTAPPSAETSVPPEPEEREGAFPEAAPTARKSATVARVERPAATDGSFGWYFRDYERSALEPFVGPRTGSGSASPPRTPGVLLAASLAWASKAKVRP